ncbi:MAG: amidohydrolase family protein [Proteobacteria bacterium]|nr:amidohydrolase family protein [Pseudomonadota bacterium]
MRTLTALILLAACNGPATDDSGPVDTGSDTGITDSGDSGDTGESPPDLTVGDPTADVSVETCSNTLPAPASGELCTVSGDPSTATHLLLQGRVLGVDKVFEDGEVLVELGDNGTIECAGCDCTEPSTTVTVSCPDGAISPGLVNAHDHIRYATESPVGHGDERYDHRHDWRRGTRGHTSLRTSSSNDREALLYGELRMLFGGATSIAGSVSSVDAQGLLRNLDAAEHNEGLGFYEANYETFPLGDSDGQLAATGCSEYQLDTPTALGFRVYLPHIAEGIDAEAQNEFLCLSSDSNGGIDLIAPNTSIIHGVGVSPANIGDISDSGSKLVWSPRSNVSLYGFTAPVTTYDAMGVPIAMGTDWTPSGSAQMLRELACADYLNEFHMGYHFTHRELWLMATRNGALALGAQQQLGQLEVGAIADIAVFDGRTRPAYEAVTQAGIGDVELVLRGSKALYGDADVLAGLRTDASSCEALSDCVADNAVCVSEDSGLTLATIKSAVGNAYPLLQCEVPVDEPSCLPYRDNEDQDGLVFPQSDIEDFDGDGVVDTVDLCPTVFDAGRPIEGYLQGDADADGIGDACDACPLTAGESGCRWGDPDDDGIPSADDNCPDDANSNQLDDDLDGIGDACDRCPSYPAASGACPEVVYDVKDGTLALGSRVVLTDMTVTATKVDRGAFLQLDVGGSGYVGRDHSGVWAYMPDLNLPAVGDKITLEGSIDDFYGQTQLNNIPSYIVQSSANALPTVEVVAAGVVETNGSRAAALESVLIRVEDVAVTAVDLPPGQGDTAPTAEFAVGGNLVVDDYLFLIEPAPVVGERFAALSGVLAARHEKSVLLPRTSADVTAGPASLAAFSETAVLLPAGTVDSSLLSLSLARPAASVETVALTCSPSAQLTCPATVDFGIGVQTLAIELTGVAASDTAATITADLNGSQANADVQVYDDSSQRSVVALDPTALTIRVDTTDSLVVTLNLPAASGGTAVALTSGGVVSHASSVTVPAGSLAVAFDITAPATAGSDTLVGTLNGTASTSITVSEGFAGSGQLFSQYLEGSSGTNKMVEVIQADSGALDLETCQVKVYANGNTSPNNTINLGPGTLNQGDVWVLCNVSDTALSGVCDQSAGGLTFNGDDALELSCGGTVQDVFGQIGTDPGTSWGTPSTADNVLVRNCSITSGDADGADSFDPSIEWSETTPDVSAGFGSHCE